MTVGDRTRAMLKEMMQGFIPKDPNAKEAAYFVYAAHPDKDGTIVCTNCDWADRVGRERKEQLREKTLCCENCGARFTKIVRT